MSQLPSEKLQSLEKAQALFQEAYRLQMEGALDEAVRLYRASLVVHPTPEAHTFLGWTYSFQGRVDEAIEECKEAIRLDPDFGNPYNDIGVYLIEKGSLFEAVPWLERAKLARNYETRHFPFLNLGRVYLALEMPGLALEEFKEALRLDPGNEEALRGIELTRRSMD